MPPAPKPCSARPTSTIQKLGDSAIHNEPAAKQATLPRNTGRRPWRSPRLASSGVLHNEHRMNTTISSPASRWSMAKASRSAGMAGAITAVSSAAMNTPMNSAGIRRRDDGAFGERSAVDMGCGGMPYRQAHRRPRILGPAPRRRLRPSPGARPQMVVAKKLTRSDTLRFQPSPDCRFSATRICDFSASAGTIGNCA